MKLKLQQGQVWKHGDEFIRIVHLERLDVGYKVLEDLQTGEGTHHKASKKEFCRLLKTATLLAPAAPAMTQQPEGLEDSSRRSKPAETSGKSASKPNAP